MKNDKAALLAKELTNEEEKMRSTDDSAEIPPSDIVAFNELRSCADLVRMYKTKQLDIKPDFQRDIVWTQAAQTRFIDSLVKQLPIPSMCISLDYKTNERLMIDGLQRINSIINFLTNDSWILSKTDDIDKRISGKTVSKIKANEYDMYSRLENLTIPVTVLRCDYSKKSHMRYLFTIFHRLNTGGNKLSNQEIRNCIFQGNFNELLKALVKYRNFRRLFELAEDKTYRFAYEEFVLRFFAFNEKYSEYKGKLAKYLNDYMDDQKNIGANDISDKRHLFERTIDLLYQKILIFNSLHKISKTTAEAIFIGIAQNINKLELESEDVLKTKFNTLLEHNDFSVESLKEGLSQKEKVTTRLNTAISIFS